MFERKLENPKVKASLYIAILFILLVGLMPFLGQIPKVEANPASVVGTSTVSSATRDPFQRKSFYANGRFWVFFAKGGYIVYSTSIDGESWSSTTNVRASPSGDYFSIWFDGTYLHYAYGYSSLIYYRRGTPNSNGTITWSAVEQTVSTTYNSTNRPMVATDSNGYVYIGYWDDFYPYVIKSGNNNGTWGTTPSGFPYQLSTSASGDWVVSIISLTTGKMLAVYAKVNDVIRAKRWDGSAWGLKTTTTSSIRGGAYHSAVAQGDDVHLVFLKSTSYDIVYVKYANSTNSFGTETTLQAGATSYSAPVITIHSNNNLYVFWAGYPTANHIYYRKYDAGTSTWETIIDWITETDGLTYNDKLTGFYQVWSGHMGLVYMAKTSSPYDIKFEYRKEKTLASEYRASSYADNLDDEILAQTFVFQNSVEITKVSLYLGRYTENPQANLTVSIRKAETLGGPERGYSYDIGPIGVDLVSVKVSVDSFLGYGQKDWVNFSLPITIYGLRRYAIVVVGENCSAYDVWWYVDASDDYPGIYSDGKALMSDDGGATWHTGTAPPEDFEFIIYGYDSKAENKPDNDLIARYYRPGGGGGGFALETVHPSATWSDSAWGQTVKLDGDYIVTRILWRLTKNGNPNGRLRTKIYAITGTYGSNSTPTDGPLATSESLNSSLIPSYPLYIWFEFDFNSTEQLAIHNNVAYAYSLEVMSGTWDSNNRASVYGQSTSPRPDGNAFYYETSSWKSYTLYDLTFYIFGSSYDLNLRTKDLNGNILTGATAYVNDTSKTSDSNGWANFTVMPDSVVEIKVKFQSILVNGTFSVNMTKDKTIDVICNVYSFGQTILATQVNVTLSKVQLANNELTWKATGTGSVTFKVQTPNVAYYLKINDVIKIEGDHWTQSGNVVTITDTLASTNSYILSFHPLETTDDGGGGSNGEATTPTEQAGEFVETVVAPSVYALTSNVVSVILLSTLLLGTVWSYATNAEGDLWKFFLTAFVVLAINFLFAFILIPTEIIPADLNILRNLVWRPPELAMQTFPMTTQIILQIVVLSVVFLTGIGSVFYLIYRED